MAIDLTPTPIGNDIQVNTTAAGSQQFSSITALDDGGFVVTWSSLGQDGSSYGIYGQRYTAAGAVSGAEFRVNTTTNSDQAFSSVTALADGGFFVNWSSYTQDAANTWGVYGQRYTAAGIVNGTEFLINTTMANSQLYSSVTTLDDGGFIVTWSSNTQDGSGFGIYGQRYTAAGVASGGEFHISTETAGDQWYPAVAALADGGFIVTWDSIGQDGSDFGVYAQRYNADGTAVGSEFRVNATTTNFQGWSSVKGLESGGFVVTWDSLEQDGSGYGIFGRLYDAAGQATTGDFLVNTVTANYQNYSSLTALDDGGFVVAFTDGNTLDGSGYGMFGQRFDAAANKLGTQFKINDITTGTQITESRWGTEYITTLSDGRLAVTWTGFGSEEVFVRLVDVPMLNTAPAGTNATLSSNEDAGYTFAAADFGFTDADVGDALVSVRIDTLPTNGTLRFDADGAGPSAPVFVVAGAVIAAADIANLTFTPAANANGNGYASFTFSVNDGDAFDPTPNTLTFNITPINDAPTAAVTNSVTTNEDTASTAVAIGAADLDDDTLTYSVKTGFEPTKGSVLFSGGSFTYTPTANANGADTFTILVDDGQGGTAEQVVSVTINPINDAPILMLTQGEVYVTEGTIYQETVEFFDADGSPPNLLLTGEGEDPGLITPRPDFLGSDFFVPSGAALDLLFQAGDFENPTDLDGDNRSTYTFYLSDGILTTTRTVTFVVRDRNDAPTLTLEIADQTAAEDNAFTYTLPASTFNDVDAGDSLTLTAMLANGQSLPSWLTFNPATRTFSGTPLNGDIGTLAIKVTATDTGFSSVFDTFDLVISNTNDAPTVTSGATGTVAENAATNTIIYTATASDPDAESSVTWSLSGADAALLNIDTEGRVRLNTSANFEAKPSYSFNVVATDRSLLFDSKAVTVGVANVNEPEVLDGGVTFALGEGDVFYVTRVWDGGDSGQPITYTVSGDTAGSNLTAGTFTNLAGGAIAFSFTAPDFENPQDADGNNIYTITITTTDGEFTDVSTSTFTVLNVNEAPTNIAISNAAVAEFASNGTIIGALSTIDPDNTIGFTYMLLDDASGRFLLDGDVVKVANGLLLDFEQQDQHTIVVQTTDPGGLSTSRQLEVNLTDINPENITGDGADNIFVGGALADQLDGAGGDDRLEGGGAGDALNGGGGFDYASYRRSDLGVSVDLVLTQYNSNDALGDTYTSIEGVIGSSENDVLRGDGNANTLNGGKSGDDGLYGRSGIDTLIGGGGRDVLEGGVGADVLDGGSDFDYATYVYASVGVLADLQYAHVNTTEAQGDTYNSIEGLQGSSFNDNLRGDAGDNWLLGGAGNDYLYGRAGTDYMYGGAGNDTFHFQNNYQIDVVQDFQAGAAPGDRVQLQINGIYGFGAEFDTFEEVMSHVSQSGVDTVIDFASGTRLVLTGVTSTALTAGDFNFV